jgi:hypothetical protein
MISRVVFVMLLMPLVFAAPSARAGMGAPCCVPGVDYGAKDPSPPPRAKPTPGDDSKLNPRHDPDVKKGINDYCANHKGGVCGK